MSQLPAVAEMETWNFYRETCPSPMVGYAFPGALVHVLYVGIHRHATSLEVSDSNLRCNG